METLSNSKITIAVKDHGAELASLRHNGREYLWQADEVFWKRHSPVLFPFVGSVWQGEYRVDGQVYNMCQHGFARDMDFKLISRSDTDVRYRLVSDESTRARYPFDFVLEIGYELIDNRVRVLWHVQNTGDRMMPFQIGAHPAFYWPMLTDDEIECGVIGMVPALAITDKRGYFILETKEHVLKRSRIESGGCFGSELTLESLDADSALELEVDTFSSDALVFEDGQVTKVTLCNQDKKPYLAVEFTAPVVGLWSTPGRCAPFVCIEPWYGRADSVDYTGELADRAWMQHLQPGESFDAYYDIIIF